MDVILLKHSKRLANHLKTEKLAADEAGGAEEEGCFWHDLEGCWLEGFWFESLKVGGLGVRRLPV